MGVFNKEFVQDWSSERNDMSKYTQAPWYCYGWSIYAEDGLPVAQFAADYAVDTIQDDHWREFCVTSKRSEEEANANTQRAVACVNACAGINPEAVPDLLEIAVSLCEWFIDGDYGPSRFALWGDREAKTWGEHVSDVLARAAITKASVIKDCGKRDCIQCEASRNS